MGMGWDEIGMEMRKWNGYMDGSEDGDEDWMWIGIGIG